MYLGKLTAKQRRFCEEYLIDLNATQAAIRAGYSVHTANRIASENLLKPDIQSKIEKLMIERSQRTAINQDKVIQELSKIAFSNISDYLKVEDNRVEVFDTDKIHKEMLAVIAEIKQTDSKLSIKLHDKLRALDLIGRHLGMFKDKLELSGELHNNPFEGLTTEELKAIIQNNK